MEDQFQTDMQLHPSLAAEVGIVQPRKVMEVHPSLATEIQPEEEQIAQETVVDKIETAESTTDKMSPVQPQESSKDRDWRAIRARADEAKQLEREKQQLERELNFYREQAARPQPPQSDDYRTDTEKHLYQEMQAVKQQLEQQKREAEETKRKATVWKAESELARDYPDIRQVVTDENVKRLEYEYPPLYNAIISSSDVYSVGAAAYEMIIAKGIYKKPVDALNHLTQSNDDLIDRNRRKPLSASAIAPKSGDTPIQRAGSFMGGSISSDEERKALYREMVEASSRKY